jgi:hypothetical protein
MPSDYTDYLRRWEPRRLGFRAKADGETHPVKALAIVSGVLLGIPLLVSVIDPVTKAISLPLFGWLFS